MRILTYGCGRGEQFKGNNAIGLATSIRQIIHLTQKHAYIRVKQSIRLLKIMGLSGYDQTACLVGVARFVAEEHSRYYHTRRRLTIERKRNEANQ